MASSRRAIRRTNELPYIPCRYSFDSLNERHLINFLESCKPGANLRQTRVTKERHSRILGGTLNLGGRPAINDHFADGVGQVQQLRNSRSAVIAASGPFQR